MISQTNIKIAVFPPVSASPCCWQPAVLQRLSFKNHNVTFLCNSGELNWPRGARGISSTPESASEIPNCPGGGKESNVEADSDSYWNGPISVLPSSRWCTDVEAFWIFQRSKIKVDGDITDLWASSRWRGPGCCLLLNIWSGISWIGFKVDAHGGSFQALQAQLEAI